MEKFTVCFYFIVTFVVCHASLEYVETLGKCSNNDEPCMISLFQALFNKLASDGFPDHNLEKIDPFVVENQHVPFVDGFTINTDKAKATGLRNCVYKKYTYNFNTGIHSQTLFCPKIHIDVETSFHITLPMIKDLLGHSNSGKGYGHALAENVTINCDLQFKPVRRDDGNIYFNFLTDQEKLTYHGDHMQVNFDKAIFGGQDFSPIINSFASGQLKWFDTVVNYYSKYFKVILSDVLPLNSYIIEDLSSYVK